MLFVCPLEPGSREMMSVAHIAPEVPSLCGDSSLPPSPLAGASILLLITAATLAAIRHTSLCRALITFRPINNQLCFPFSNNFHSHSVQIFFFRSNIFKCT